MLMTRKKKTQKKVSLLKNLTMVGAVATASIVGVQGEENTDLTFAGITIKNADYLKAQQDNEILQLGNLIAGNKIGLSLQDIKIKNKAYVFLTDKASASITVQNDVPFMQFFVQEKEIVKPMTQTEFKTALPQVVDWMFAMDDAKVIDLQEVAKKAVKSEKGAIGFWGRLASSTTGIPNKKIEKEMEKKLTLSFANYQKEEARKLALAKVSISSR